MTIIEKANAYDEAVENMRKFRNALNNHEETDLWVSKKDIVTDIEYYFPELKESERVRNEIIAFVEQAIHRGGGTPIPQEQEDSWIAWLEKQRESQNEVRYWTEEEIEPIISDYLRGAEHYGGMIARLRCLKPKSLEKQSKESKVEETMREVEKKAEAFTAAHQGEKKLGQQEVTKRSIGR